MTATQVRRLALVVLAAALIVAQEVIGYRAGVLPEPWGLTRTIVHTLAGLSYAACAWLAWQSAASPVPARIMLVIAFLWLPPTFVATTWGNGWLWPLLESVGLFWAVLQALLVAVYPTGRFQGRVEKWVLLVGAVAGLARFVAVLLFYQPPAESCVCAPNPYALFANNALYAAIDIGFRLVGVVLIFVIVGSVTVRWIRGSTPARNVAFIMPVALLLWGVTAMYTSVVYTTGSTLDLLLTYISLAAVAAVPISFVAGLIYVQSLRGRVSDLIVLTGDGVDRHLWQGVLADTVRDDDLKVYWWDASRGRYLDGQGAVVDGAAPEARGKGRALMAIDSPTGRLALIDHDAVLSENPQLLDAVATAVRLTVDNERLREELERTLQEVRSSRVRIIEAGILARRRIERDLHDGSQQSLVSLALSLRMAIGRARASGNEELGADIEAALGQLTDALRQLRELARGIHPSSLTVGGLGMAVGELVAKAPFPVDVDVSVQDRLPPLTEATVYFFVAECFTNIAKYAGASRCRVVLALDDDGLRVSVSDDGIGGADTTKGTGLMGLVDRIEALGGVVTVVSPAGGGTSVTAIIPPTALA